MAVVNRNTTEQRGITKGRAEVRLSPITLILGALSCIGMLISIWGIFVYAPYDAVQGAPQKIFYFHVPLSTIAMLSYGVLAVASLGYLIRRDERWDWVARASAELGAIFTTLALFSGSIWGRPIWGTWWTWDARLTTTLILWFLYVGYLMLRNAFGRASAGAGARAGAVLGILGVIDVPIIYLSVNWWRTLHPQSVLPIGQQAQLPPEMLSVFLICMVTFTLFYAFLMIQLYQLEKMQTLAVRLHALVEE